MISTLNLLISDISVIIIFRDCEFSVTKVFECFLHFSNFVIVIHQISNADKVLDFIAETGDTLDSKD